MPAGMMPVIFSVLERLIPFEAKLIAIEAFNKRLNTTNLTMEQVAATAAERNLTVQDLMAMVEIEGWEYDGLRNYSTPAYVCSAYVAGAYEAAGLLVDVQATEFTPKDVYSLKIFDSNF